MHTAKCIQQNAYREIHTVKCMPLIALCEMYCEMYCDVFERLEVYVKRKEREQTTILNKYIQSFYNQSMINCIRQSLTDLPDYCINGSNHSPGHINCVR